MEKRPSDKLCFLQNSHNKNEFAIKVFPEEYIEEFIDKVNHRNGWENSGYAHVECELYTVIDIPETVYQYRIEWAKFIVENFGVKKYQELFLRELGWFEFSEINNSDKWLESFFSYHKQKQMENQNSNNKGIQTELF